MGRQLRKYYNATYSIGPLWLIGMCVNVLRFMLKYEGEQRLQILTRLYLTCHPPVTFLGVRCVDRSHLGNEQ